MTQEELKLQKDRMRYTKDSLSSSLVLAAIVFDALYFVSIYQSDVGTYFYNWITGASIIYNLLFMLFAFLCSEGVKNRKSGYSPALIAIGLMQVARIFYLPARAHEAVAEVRGEMVTVMGDGQYTYVVACLLISAVCCVLAAVTSYRNNKILSDYLKSIENESA